MPVERKSKMKGPPKGWKELFTALKNMRNEIKAPVDTMGCDVVSPEIIDVKTRRFHILVSLMMSSQTKDTVNYQTMQKLKDELPGGLNISSIMNIDVNVLDKMISKVGFHTRKASYIKKAAIILNEEYDDDIPKSLAGLQQLPGVGPKMAHLCMQSAWGIVEGIGVDTHVHRIAGLWKWTSNARTPEETRVQLESWLPRQHWREINALMVGLGQSKCLPRGRDCSSCQLNRLCPASKKDIEDSHIRAIPFLE